MNRGRTKLSTEDLDKPRDEAGADSPVPRKLHRLAFGIERIGLISLHFPYVYAALLVVLAIFAAIGVEQSGVGPGIRVQHRAIARQLSLGIILRAGAGEQGQYEERIRRAERRPQTAAFASDHPA